jgi:hypothetical protein
VSSFTLNRLVRLADDEAAQGMVEYLLTVSLVVLMVVGIFGAFIHQFHK